MYSFSYLEPVCCSMSSSNCCFLTCIQISQEADQVVWYSHLLQNFPQFIVIHIVEGFGVVTKEEIDVFLECSSFFDDPGDIGNLSFPTSKEELLPGAGGLRRAEKSYSTFKVRKGGCEKIPLLQGKEQRMRFAGAAVKRYLMSKVRESQVRW